MLIVVGFVILIFFDGLLLLVLPLLHLYLDVPLLTTEAYVTSWTVADTTRMIR